MNTSQPSILLSHHRKRSQNRNSKHPQLQMPTSTLPMQQPLFHPSVHLHYSQKRCITHHAPSIPALWRWTCRRVLRQLNKSPSPLSLEGDRIVSDSCPPALHLNTCAPQKLASLSLFNPAHSIETQERRTYRRGRL